MVLVVRRGGAQGRHHLTLDARVEVPDEAAYLRHPAKDALVVVSLSEVVPLASALAAAEDLQGTKRGAGRRGSASRGPADAFTVGVGASKRGAKSCRIFEENPKRPKKEHCIESLRSSVG